MAKLSHKQLMASLTAQERSQLTHRANQPGLYALAVHFGLIIVLGLLVYLRIPAWPLLILPLGILLVFLFTLMHEVTHRTAFKTPALNKLVAIICAWLLFLPPDWFRYFHFAHHRFTQNPQKDPELQTPKPATRLAYLWRISGVPVLVSSVNTIVRNAAGRCGDDFVPQKARPQIARESRLMIVAYVSVAVVSAYAGVTDVLLMCWLLPMITGQPFLRLYLMAEHTECPLVDNMFANTRTVFTNRVMRRLAWNMPFHTEHHVYPNVPFHRLPAFHQLVQSRLEVTSNGYVDFHRQILHTIKR